MTGKTRCPAPWTQAELSRIGAVAGRMASIYAGGWVDTEVAADEARARLLVRRAASPSATPYPSLIDASLVWLILESAAPGALVAELTWQRDRALRAGVSDPIPSHARAQLERYARTIAFEATRPAVPLCGHVDPGRGAWEQAGYAAMDASACPQCPFRLGSNLDCESCRADVLRRKTAARWDRQRVVQGLVALEFDEQVAAEAALQTELVLRQIRRPFLSHAFFEHWELRYGEATRDVFAVDDDRHIAREQIEAQMVQPWFGEPPVAEVLRPLPPPPTLTDEEVQTQGRRLVRALMLSGLTRSQAERRVQAVLLLRRLLAAEGVLVERELEGVIAGVVGDLERAALEVRDGERLLIRVSASPLGRSVETGIDLDDEERARITEALTRAHRRLMAQVERGHPRDDEDDPLIEAGLTRLRASLEGDAKGRRSDNDAP